MPQHKAALDMIETPKSSASRVRLGRIAKLAGVRIAHVMPDEILSKRADMDRLPITADPAMWSDEQLAEVLSTPLLVERLKEDPELLKKVLEQAAKRKLGPQTAPSGEGEDWDMPDTGWFLIHFGWTPVGFVKGQPMAAGVMRSMLDKIERGEASFTDAESFGHDIYKETRRILKEQGGRGYSRASTYNYANAAGMDFEDVAREFVKHPFHGKRRRQVAEQCLRSIKAPGGFEPSPDARISGARPTAENSGAARDDLDRHKDSTLYYDREEDMDMYGSDAMIDAVDSAEKQNRQTRREAAKELAKPIAKKVKWVKDYRKEHKDWPEDEKMADDIVFADSALNRILRMAIAMDKAGDADGVKSLSRQLDLYAERSMKRAHMVPSKETKTPEFWKPNMDYAGFEGSPWRGSMSEFQKRFKSLGEFLKWRKKTREKEVRAHTLENLNAPMRKQAMKDVHTALMLFNVLEIEHHGLPLRESHYVPEGGDDVDKLGDKEPKLWSDNPKHKTIEEFLDAYRKHHENDSNDGQLALDAAREMVRYWALLLKKPKRKRRK